MEKSRLQSSKHSHFETYKKFSHEHFRGIETSKPSLRYDHLYKKNSLKIKIDSYEQSKVTLYPELNLSKIKRYQFENLSTEGPRRIKTERSGLKQIEVDQTFQDYLDFLPRTNYKEIIKRNIEYPTISKSNISLGNLSRNIRSSKNQLNDSKNISNIPLLNFNFLTYDENKNFVQKASSIEKGNIKTSFNLNKVSFSPNTPIRKGYSTERVQSSPKEIQVKVSMKNGKINLFKQLVQGVKELFENCKIFEKAFGQKRLYNFLNEKLTIDRRIHKIIISNQRMEIKEPFTIDGILERILVSEGEKLLSNVKLFTRNSIFTMKSIIPNTERSRNSNRITKKGKFSLATAKEPFFDDSRYLFNLSVVTSIIEEENNRIIDTKYKIFHELLHHEKLSLSERAFEILEKQLQRKDQNESRQYVEIKNKYFIKKEFNSNTKYYISDIVEKVFEHENKIGASMGLSKTERQKFQALNKMCDGMKRFSEELDIE